MRTTNLKTQVAIIQDRSESTEELIGYITGCDHLAKNLRSVFDYAVITTACSGIDLPREVCSDLSFFHSLIEYVEQIEKDLK